MNHAIICVAWFGGWRWRPHLVTEFGSVPADKAVVVLGLVFVATGLATAFVYFCISLFVLVLAACFGGSAELVCISVDPLVCCLIILLHRTSTRGMGDGGTLPLGSGSGGIGDTCDRRRLFKARFFMTGW